MILQLIGVLVITCVIYLGFIIWGIGKLIKIFGRRRKLHAQRGSQEEHCESRVSPIFRIIGSYFGAIWMSLLIIMSAFMMAVHRLHAIERSTYVAYTLFLFFPYSLVFIVLVQRLTNILASKRQERPFRPHLPGKLYLVSIITGIIIFFIVQERNPLKKDGVDFEWYDPTDELVSYHIVHMTRMIHGQIISGPLCTGRYPRIIFADVNQDHRQEIVISTRKGEELGVIEVIEPYVPEQPAFKIIRGTCYFPDNFDLPADYLKVSTF